MAKYIEVIVSETVDSGTTTSAATKKLVQTGQNFTETVKVGDIVENTTDSTSATVTAVDSDTTLSINKDIMASAEAYTIRRNGLVGNRHAINVDLVAATKNATAAGAVEIVLGTVANDTITVTGVSEVAEERKFLRHAIEDALIKSSTSGGGAVKIVAPEGTNNTIKSYSIA